MNIRDSIWRNKFEEKRGVTVIVTPLFHTGCGQTSVFASGRNSQDSGRGRRSASLKEARGCSISSVESFSLPPYRPAPTPFREKTGKRTLTLRGRMAWPDARETRENCDSIRLSETRYTGKEQVYEEQIPSRSAPGSVGIAFDQR